MALIPGGSTRPARTAFYDPPVLAADGVPGQILRAEPMTARLLGVGLPARAWRVLYRSETATGEPAAVSGVVLIPTRRPVSRKAMPLLGFAPGTQGHARVAAAVSRQLEWGVEYEAIQLLPVLARGWAVAITDYGGLGTPGTHPYVIGPANGRAVLDCMRAARNLAEADLDPTAPAAIFGYSEGGNAAGWALQLQPTYAPELALAAAAVGAAPVDMQLIRAEIDRGWWAFLQLYAGIGYDAAYPELQLDRYLNQRGRRVVALLRRTHILAAIGLGLLLPKDSRFYLAGQDPWKSPPWCARMRENDLGGLAPATAVLLGHGRQDQVISPRQTRILLRRWRQLGVDVRLHEVRFGEHVTAAPQFLRAALAFFDSHLEDHRPETPDLLAG